MTITLSDEIRRMIEKRAGNGASIQEFPLSRTELVCNLND